MQFVISDPIPLSEEEALTLMRDNMTTLVPFMPDTESIEELSREGEGDEVKVVKLWRASTENVPKALRSFIKPELMSWRDHASWSTSERRGTWELEPMAGGQLFDCSGVTSIKAHPQGALLEITVNLDIYPERLPGVPKLLAKTIRGQVEKFIGQILSDNMRQLAQSVTRYAESQR